LRYLLTGGATGGHVYPALAVADELRRRDPEAQFLYVGVRGRLEESVVPARGYRIRFVRARPYPRSKSPLALAWFALHLSLGILAATILLLHFRPHVIFGTGGFVSAPVMFACGALRKIGLSRSRLFVYSPDAQPGLMNQIAGRLADRVGVVFEQAARWFDMKRVAIVGFPVRRELLDLDRSAARTALDVPADRFVIFAVGGSQGSRVINQAVVDALSHLQSRSDELFVLHTTGRIRSDGYDAVADTASQVQALGLAELDSWYRQCEYFDQIEVAYAAADVVICRGGISTLTEIGVAGLPAIIVPLSTAAEDHQAVNARTLERAGAARVLFEEAEWCAEKDSAVALGLPGERLAAVVVELLLAGSDRATMATAARNLQRRDSLELIMQEIDNLVQGRRPRTLSLEFPVAEGKLPADPNRLLRHVRKRVQEAGSVDGLCAEELAYLRYQADRHLASEAFYEIPLGRRNVGVKLVGVLHYEQRLDLILALLGDRRPMSAMQRWAGGDYRHSGILRRNAIDFPLAMIGLRRGGRPVRAAVLEALATDPYFEVRAAAARLLGNQVEPGDAEVEAALCAALDDHADAVLVEVLAALASIGSRPDLLERLRFFYVHRDWRCRHETVHALDRLLERGVLRADDVAGDVEQILSTSPNFNPTFPLADSIESLARRIRDNQIHDSVRDGREAAHAVN
jgi:UDP-N-acetylglucosamine--N-acetylmuramyl-(pentapeptide) pyrophosphoryl-undecaprenol N-acetylglucosamine transferase